MLPVLGDNASNKQCSNDWVVEHVSWKETEYVTVEVVSAHAPYGMEAGITNQSGHDGHSDIGE